VSINNHVSGTGAGTAKKALALLTLLRQYSIASAGHGDAFAFFDAHQTTVQGQATAS
jgi:hypothetical protein